MIKKILKISKDFSATPGGRFANEGDFSGEEFRNSKLRPEYEKALKGKNKLIIDLDGCMGYPSSFLDESFGGLARLYPEKNILDTIEFISQDQPGLIEEIKGYILTSREYNDK